MREIERGYERNIGRCEAKSSRTAFRTAEIRESRVSHGTREGEKGEEDGRWGGEVAEKRRIEGRGRGRTEFPDRRDGRFRPVRSMPIIPTSRANGADRYGRFSSFAWSVRSVCSGRSHETRDTHTHTHIHRGLARNCSVSRTEPNELEKERYLPVGNSCQSVELIARRTNLSVVEVRGRKEEGARERKLTVSFEENQESKEVLGLAVTGRLEKLERMGRGCMVARETASEGGGGGGGRRREGSGGGWQIR